MLAVTIRAHRGPEQVYLADLPRPSAPGPRDVVVAPRAAALNHLDLFVLGGMPGLATSERSGRRFGEVVLDIAA
jgi:NADPH:quinone reductase-like Zn-dependent oxidoreductase